MTLGGDLQAGGGGGGEKTPLVSKYGRWRQSHRKSIGGRCGGRFIRILEGQCRYTKPGSSIGGKEWKVMAVHIKG